LLHLEHREGGGDKEEEEWYEEFDSLIAVYDFSFRSLPCMLFSFILVKSLVCYLASLAFHSYSSFLP
jgi:hypothetical protein